jgi:hypothetical protein
MQVDSFTLLKGWIASNPNCHKNLDMPQTKQGGLHGFPCAPTDWMEFNVNPPGAASALFFLKDPLYGQAAPRLRSQMLLEKQTELTLALDSDMRSGKLMRMRRKMHEWLATDPSRLTKETLADVWDILCTVCNIQTICLEESVETGQTTITFSPANVTTWRPDIPVHFVEKGLSKVWVYVGQPHKLRRSLGVWLGEREDAGAHIVYPTMETTKADLVSFLEVLPSWNETMRKMKKDDLAPIAGRAQVIEMFHDWVTLTPQMQLFCDDI